MNIILFEEIPQFIPLSDPRGRHLKKVLKAQAGDCLKAGLVNGLRRPRAELDRAYAFVQRDAVNETAFHI